MFIREGDKKLIFFHIRRKKIGTFLTDKTIIIWWFTVLTFMTSGIK